MMRGRYRLTGGVGDAVRVTVGVRVTDGVRVGVPVAVGVTDDNVTCMA
jgi:hypothetical protein